MMYIDSWILGSIHINNCLDYDHSWPYVFSCAVLTHTCIYAGPPSPPDPHLYMFSATTIQLSWLPPFSWGEYPIVNYSVQVHNRATGEGTNSTINVISTEMFSMAASVTFVYSTPGGVQNCEEFVFSVSAANNIGWSSPAVVTGGFPIGYTHCILQLLCFLFGSVYMHTPYMADKV